MMSHPLTVPTHLPATRRAACFTPRGWLGAHWPIAKVTIIVMCSLCWCASPAAAAPPTVTLTPLSGDPIAGLLTRCDNQQVAVGDLTVPTASVLDLQVAGQTLARERPAINVQLTDGSLLTGIEIELDLNTVRLTSNSLGSISLPRAAVAAMSMQPVEGELRARWLELTQAASQTDLLVVRKGDSIDPLGGVVGSVDAAQVGFLLDDTQIPVKRERVFGLVFRQSATGASAARPPAIVRTVSHDLLGGTLEASDDNGVTLRLSAGSVLAIPWQDLVSIDLSAGKVQYLSDLPAEGIRYEPCTQVNGQGEYDAGFQIRTNLNMYGEPLRLEGRTFARGLCLHSMTEVRYRVAGQFRRLVGRAGLDPDAGNAHGHLHLTIKADDRVLFDRDLSGREPSVVIDLPIENTRFLTILVDCGPDQVDLGDNLNFVDARVTK